MRPPVDVLQVLRSLNVADPAQRAALTLACTAVAELIDADSEYDRARAAWLADNSKHNEFLAAREAWTRRVAALARAKGEAA